MGRRIPALVAVALALTFGAARAAPAAVIVTVVYTFAPGDTEEPAVPLRVERGRPLYLVNADVLGYHT